MSPRTVQQSHTSLTTVPDHTPTTSPIVPATTVDPLVTVLATRWGIKPDKMLAVVKATVFRGDAARATDEELMMFLHVCSSYNLNPFLKQIHAFIGKGGGVFPVVGVDGWVAIVNREPDYNGCEFQDHSDATGKLTAITCTIHVKGRAVPTALTEYFKECYRDTEPWNRWPNRMLRHKAYIQTARYAFGLSGLYDEDEIARIKEMEDAVDVTPRTIPQPKPLPTLSTNTAPPLTLTPPATPATTPQPAGNGPGPIDQETHAVMLRTQLFTKVRAAAQKANVTVPEFLQTHTGQDSIAKLNIVACQELFDRIDTL